jgi:hypothetical protein
MLAAPVRRRSRSDGQAAETGENSFLSSIQHPVSLRFKQSDIYASNHHIESDVNPAKSILKRLMILKQYSQRKDF